MTLPYSTIGRIADQAYALPSTFNVINEKIDANLANHETRLTAREQEINAARGGSASLGDRLDDIDTTVTGLDPDMQNSLVAAVMQALSQAGTAGREIRKTLSQRFQTGEVTIQNRGIITGCTVTRSANATRNCSMAAGRIFVGGQIVPIDGETNGAAVPGNSAALAKTCYLYLGKKLSGKYEMYCTELGADVPASGIALYKVAVPAGNTEASDPYIANCVLTDIRRIEAGAPAVFTTAPLLYVTLPYSMLDADYAVDIDVEDFNGCGFQLGYVYASDKAANGFKLCCNGTADNVKVRWTARKLSL